MPIESVTSLDDPRVAFYRNLKDRELDRSGRWFIAEGEYIVRRLLASDFPVESGSSAEKRAAELAAIVPAGVPVYTASLGVMEKVLGFAFHSGIIACGRRAPTVAQEVVPKGRERLALVVCPDLSNVENIGSVVRLCALRRRRPCPRREVPRPLLAAVRPRLDGDRLQAPAGPVGQPAPRHGPAEEEWGVELAATVLDDSAEPLAKAARPAKFGLLFGGKAGAGGAVRPPPGTGR